MAWRILSTLCFVLIMSVVAAEAAEQISTSGCSDAAYSQLDFWVGNWNVYVSGKLDGTDLVEKILKHCAIVENWREADGSGEGKSLFYYVAATKTWSKCGALTRGP